MHAALIDTAQLMAIDPGGSAPPSWLPAPATRMGVKAGSSATRPRPPPALGTQLLRLKIAAAVREIRQKLAAIPSIPGKNRHCRRRRFLP